MSSGIASKMIRLYYDLLSQPARAVYIFLNINKIPFEKKEIALRKGEQRTDEYAKINPFQAVPVIQDEDFTLTESVAIIRYLCKKYQSSIPDHWYPKELKNQARVDEYLEWQHLNTRVNCAMFFQLKWLIPLMTASEPDMEKVEQAQDRMEVTLDRFETVWLKDKPYLTGNTISVADILATCELEQPSICAYDVFEGRPKLKQWFERVKGELQPSYDDAHKYVYNLREKYKGAVPKSKF